MALVSPRQVLRRAGTTGRLVLAGCGLCLALAGCGVAATASSGAAASATPTCPPTSTFKSVAGTISATGSNTITVTNSSGAQVVVQLSSSTRITKQVTVSPASIAAGTSVLIVSDTNATTAQRIAVLSASGGGTGSGGFGRFGGGRGTPGANRNSACFSRTPGAGRASGTGGTFQGLRGTVASVTSSQIVIDDTQGQTFSLAITSSTMTTSTASGTSADLVTGAKVSASGVASGSKIEANSITVQAAG